MSSTKRRSKAASPRRSARAAGRQGRGSAPRRRAGMTFACVVVITAPAGAAFAAGPVMALLRSGGSVAASANP